MRFDVWRLLIVLWLLAPAAVWASPMVPVPTACSESMTSLASSAGVLRDDSRSLTADAVMQFPDSRFHAVNKGETLGYGGANWWMRIELRNTGDKKCRRWLVVGPASLRYVSVFLRQGNDWHVMHGGSGYPLSEWALPERKPVFPLVLEPGTTTVLVRIYGSGEMVSLTPQLWSPVAFLHHESKGRLVNGMIFGSVLLLVLVGTFLGYFYRYTALYWLALSVGFFTAFIITQANYPYLYLWPEQPGFNQWLRFFLANMALVCIYGYLRVVTQPRRLGPLWSWLFIGIMAIFAFVAMFGGLLPPTLATLPTMMTVVTDQMGRLFVLVVVIMGWWRGTWRYWYPVVLCVLLYIQSLWLFGLLDLSQWPLVGSDMYASNVFAMGLFLLLNMIVLLDQGRKRELHARKQLDEQRATEAKRLERTVTQRTGELDRALKTRRQLLGRISHDLRAPLAGMLNSVHQWRAGDTRRDYPQLVERHAHQQMEMIDELLEFSRAELSELEPQPVPGYLYAFLNEVVEQAELTAEYHGNRLKRDFAVNLPALVSIDFHYLRRVLINLLGNASKFTDHGNIRFAVQLRPASSINGIRLHFIIDDDGPGMASADRERLLQPFTRGADTAQHEGHGLGLAIVTQLLERMEGELQIDDAPGGGGRFHFELETTLAAEGDLEPLVEDGGTARDINGADRVVLVVDDESQQREVVCDLFDSYGFDSIAVADGHAALDILQTRQVDLVLTDQYMDGMDGWGLLRAVRNRQPHLPVALYSSVPPRPPEDCGNEVAFDAALLKPVDGGSLLRKIIALLEGGTAAGSGARAGSG